MSVVSSNLPTSSEIEEMSAKPLSTVSHQQTDAEIARTLIKIACGEGPIGRFAKDCLEELYPRLASVNPAWTKRKLRSIYHGEHCAIHFYEIVDLIRVCAQDTGQLDQALKTVIATFWGGLRR